MKKKLKELVQESNKILDPIIDEHKSKKRDQGKVEEDLVDVLLNFHKDNVANSHNLCLSTDNIKAVVLVSCRNSMLLFYSSVAHAKGFINS